MLKISACGRSPEGDPTLEAGGGARQSRVARENHDHATLLLKGKEYELMSWKAPKTRRPSTHGVSAQRAAHAIPDTETTDVRSGHTFRTESAASRYRGYPIEELAETPALSSLLPDISSPAAPRLLAFERATRHFHP